MEEKDKVRILLVEDNEGHALLTKDLFRRVGVTNEIVHLKDGQEAWDYISGKALPVAGCLMLLDIRLPRLDGFELLRRIKADPELKVMTVIILTSSDDPKEMALSAELGCAAYLNKPLQFEKFTQAINKQGLAVEILGKTGAG
ncbi:MAG: response regulator [Elusimicrobiales bacterium]|nr:response regulator [Elusimicrobiales bacterium]